MMLPSSTKALILIVAIICVWIASKILGKRDLLKVLMFSIFTWYSCFIASIFLNRYYFHTNSFFERGISWRELWTNVEGTFLVFLIYLFVAIFIYHKTQRTVMFKATLTATLCVLSFASFLIFGDWAENEITRILDRSRGWLTKRVISILGFVLQIAVIWLIPIKEKENVVEEHSNILDA